MKKVLVVDDVGIIRNLLRIHLQKDFIVEEASNADDALAKAATFKPDAMILDINMPGGSMDGNELCKLLKASDMFKHIFVLMLTADWRTVQKEGDDFTADEYTFKPFYGHDILAMLKKGVPDVA